MPQLNSKSIFCNCVLQSQAKEFFFFKEMWFLFNVKFFCKFIPHCCSETFILPESYLRFFANLMF